VKKLQCRFLDRCSGLQQQRWSAVTKGDPQAPLIRHVRIAVRPSIQWITGWLDGRLYFKSERTFLGDDFDLSLDVLCTSRQEIITLAGHSGLLCSSEDRCGVCVSSIELCRYGKIRTPPVGPAGYGYTRTALQQQQQQQKLQHHQIAHLAKAKPARPIRKLYVMS